MGFDVLRNELVTALQIDDYGRAKKAIIHMRILQAAERGNIDGAKSLIDKLENKGEKPDVSKDKPCLMGELYRFPEGITKVTGIDEGALIYLPNREYLTTIGERFCSRSVSRNDVMCVVTRVLDKCSPTTIVVLCRRAN